jgi:hypothetical protein
MDYSNEFKSNEQISEDAQRVAAPVNKHLASHLRRRLANGYPPNSRFLQVLAQISDAELVQQEREFSHEKTEHLALTAMYKNRLLVEKDTSGVTSFESLCKKAELAHATA